MPLYESVFIARNDITQAQVDAVADQVAGILTEQGGEVKKREYWGLRGLAYRIKKNRKGHYMLLGIDATPAAMQEVERQLGLNEDVLRVLTLRIEAIDEAPSAILSRPGASPAAAATAATSARNSAPARATKSTPPPAARSKPACPIRPPPRQI